MKFSRKIMIDLVLAALIGVMPQASYAADTITAAEIEHFEQTWETWAQDIARGIHPGLKLSVIARIEFSQKPEQLDAYEKMKMAGHLPGLPEVTDPNYARPLDSPLYALVAKKHIRVVFHDSLSPGEKALIEEVVRAKLKVGSQDAFSSEMIPISSRENSSQDSIAVIVLFALLFCIGLFTATWIFLKQRKKIERAPAIATPHPERPHEPAKAKVPTQEPSIPAFYQIMNADPSIRRAALARMKPEIIAKSTLNCSRRFSNEILGDLDQEHFDLVNQWLIQHPKIVSLAESNYSRLLLSARIQQIENQRVLSAIASLQTRSKNQETIV